MPPPAAATVCSANAHRPKNKQKRADRRYWLFEAASSGCIPCVSRLLEQEGVDPTAVSLCHGYSALDFALWGQSQGSPQAGDVASYLQAQYPHMPCQTVHWDWTGERLLEQQGWRPGQSLGEGHAADALLTPPSPEEPWHGWGGWDARTRELAAAFRATKWGGAHVD